MAVKTSWAAGDVLLAADLTDTFAAKAPLASPTFTGNAALPSTTKVNGTSDLGAAWTAWTPTVTAEGGTLTSYTVNSAAYIQIGKTVMARFDITITNAGTGNSSLQVTAPVTAKVNSQVGCGREYGVNGKALWAAFIASTTTISVRNYDATTMIATNARAVCEITYEAA